jgi:lactoylglutathione lyase
VTETLATFAFTKLVVHDLESSARFYEVVCGMKQLQRVKADIAGAPIDEIICGTETGMGVILLQWLDGRSVPVGEVILGFTTPDIRSMFDRARAAGGRVRDEPALSAASGGFVVGFLEDPEGHLLEVVEQAGA